MRSVSIVMTGCLCTPKWETLQEVIKEAICESGVLTRISRVDKGVDYRGLGKYELTFVPYRGNEIDIELDVRG